MSKRCPPGTYDKTPEAPYPSCLRPSTTEFGGKTRRRKHRKSKKSRKTKKRL